MTRTRRKVFALLMSIYLVRLWKYISKDVTPFDWLMLVAELVVIFLIAYEIWCKEWLEKRRRRKVLSKTFAMTFDDDSVAKVVPRGHQVVAVNILIGHTTELKRFSFRFVRTAEGVDESPEIVSITRVRVERNPSPDGLQEWTDGKGGRYGRWPVSPTFDNGEALHFLLDVTAIARWDGYMSFRSYDADGQVRYARKPFSFSEIV